MRIKEIQKGDAWYGYRHLFEGKEAILIEKVNHLAKVRFENPEDAERTIKKGIAHSNGYHFIDHENLLGD